MIRSVPAIFAFALVVRGLIVFQPFASRDEAPRHGSRAFGSGP